MGYEDLYESFSSRLKPNQSNLNQMNDLADSIANGYNSYAYQTFTPFGREFGTNIGVLAGSNPYNYKTDLDDYNAFMNRNYLNAYNTNSEKFNNIDRNIWFGQQLLKGLRANAIHRSGSDKSNTYSMTFGNDNNGFELGRTIDGSGTSKYLSGNYTNKDMSFGIGASTNNNDSTYTVKAKKAFDKDTSISAIGKHNKKGNSIYIKYNNSF